ncbi:MAG: AAA family ATPase [Proteobacteria bacterium]|nr:AAA family ATPase [Pseudomonadota bacterium]
MKKLPIGKQEYSKLVKGDCVYVDKTEFLMRIVENDFPTFFARPRRFGKSLTVSTFKELFSGNRELFKNTYAYDNWNFDETNPVLRLDLSLVTGANPSDVEALLLRLVRKCAAPHSVAIEEDIYANAALDELIYKVSEKKPVVVLIDEYDAPILDNLKNENLGEIKRILRAFYKTIKAAEEHIRFLFITGISKFSQVGVFSAMNNLDDISLDDDFAALAGYTQEEIKHNFPDHIAAVQTKLKLDDEEFWDRLAHYYNGYSWDGTTFIYNPFSILSFLKKKNFHPYWMATGSPSFIVEYAGDVKLDGTDLEEMQVYKGFMDQKDIDESTPESFLTQAGYLTIKSSEDEFFTLGFPNYEVRRAFNGILLSSRFGVRDGDLLDVGRALTGALRNGDADKIVNQFKIVFSSIPYMYYDSNKNEHFYSATLLMFLQAAGFDAGPERIGNKGRLDLSLKYNDAIYIMELKNDKPAVALKQIRENNYGGKYLNKTVVNIGLQIDFDERNIVDYLVE